MGFLNIKLIEKLTVSTQNGDSSRRNAAKDS
jgi:hypothetical protein